MRRSDSSRGSDDTDWGEVLERAVAGDRVAYLKVVRLATGFLIHWRAHDFAADWDDMVQEVVLSVFQASAEGKLDARVALKAYVWQATRFKFIDKVRRLQRRGPEAPVEDDQNLSDAVWPPSTQPAPFEHETRLVLEQALARLPEQERLAVVEIHARGRTYQEAADSTGIPLGTLKRALRNGLARLREEIGPELMG